MSKVTIGSLQKMKQAGEKITALTSYDASFARLFHEQGIDIQLIGDSLGNVLHGADSTLSVTVPEIAYHTRAVRRGAPEAFVMADMPFMSYPDTATACDSAAQLMRAGANMVKLEGGDWLADTVRHLTRQGVPVCAHLGLLPQTVHVMGGYKVQGREPQQAEELRRHAQLLEEAGAQLLVVECIPADLGRQLSEQLHIPVIGIGAGPMTDGQILVMHDMLGLASDYLPKFVKNFMPGQDSLAGAVAAYRTAVRDASFPGPEHTFK